MEAGRCTAVKMVGDNSSQAGGGGMEKTENRNRKQKKDAAKKGEVHCSKDGWR